MTTININSTKSTKITRVEAIDYALNNLENMPQDIQETLEKIRDSFTKKPAKQGESKAAKENKELAARVSEYVKSHFDESDPTKINARDIANNVPGVMTTQKVTAVIKYCDDVQRVKINGRVFYVPADVEIVE